MGLPARLAALAVVVVAAAGCASMPVRSPTPVRSPPASASGVRWAPVDSLNAGLPPTIRVFAGTADTLRAWAVRLDGVPLDVVVSDSAQGTSAFAAAPACVALNAGYFNMATGRPIGLVVDGGRQVSPAFRAVGRDEVPYTAARGAVGVTREGSAQIAWAWDTPEGACQLDAPIANRPGMPGRAGAVCRPWPVREAVGAGPVLLRDGRVVVTSDAEVFFGTSIPGIRHPRSAVGVEPGGAVWLVVVDGRQPASRGASLGELALVMRDLGAADALNLDGGGSSALAVRVGKRVVRLNRPTGYDVERPVPTALVARCDGRYLSPEWVREVEAGDRS